MGVERLIRNVCTISDCDWDFGSLWFPLGIGVFAGWV